MKYTVKIFLILLIFWLKPYCSGAQNPKLKPGHRSAVDSLYTEFDNTIYYTYYNPKYMTITTPTFTILKIDIDGKGNATDIRFSDSADATFVKAWVNKNNYHDDKATLTRYAKIKGYKDVALLIPVSYQPNYPYQKKVFTYDELEGIMKFDKQDITGKSILLAPIKIRVLPTGNM